MRDETGRKLSELRRSSAAGTHGKAKESRKYDRRNKKREAIYQNRRDNGD